MTIPQTTTPASRQDPRILIIYGPPKIGKTEALSRLPDALIIDTEKGSDWVAARKLQINSFDELNTFFFKLSQEPTKPRIVAFDTVDEVESWCEKEATRRYRLSNMGKTFNGNSVLELPNGGGYLWLRNVFYEALGKMKNCAERVILVGHVRDKNIEIQGKEVAAKDLDLTGKIRTIACSLADSIGYIYRSPEGKTSITFRTSQTVACGSRAKHLIGFDGELDWSKIYIDQK